MSDDITHDLDLLDDWLAGKGYGEEAGLVLRALTLIHKQAREIDKLRAALKPFEKEADGCGFYDMKDCDAWQLPVSMIRAAAAALKETGDD